MKHGVDGPLVGERKLVRYWRDHLSDGEGAVSSRG